MLSRLRTLGKETAIYGTSTVLMRLLNFFLLPFYTYVLAPEQFGVVATVYAYIAFFNTIFQYGMDQAYMRFTAADRAHEKRFFSSSFWPLVATSAIFTFLIWLFSARLATAPGIGHGYENLVPYAGVVMATDAVMCVPFAKLRLEHRPLIFAGIKMANIIINIAGNIFFLRYLHMGPEGALIASVISSAVSLLLLLPVVRTSLTLEFSLSQFKEMWHFAWPFIPAGLAATAVQVIDRPILAHLTNEHTVGIYQAGYRLGIFMMLIVSMFDQAWRPFFMENAEKPGAPDLFARIFTYFALFGTTVVLGLSLFINNIVYYNFFGLHLINSRYWDGLAVVPVVLAGYLFYGLYINFMAGPMLAKKTKLIVWATAAGAISNIGANFLLIPYLGFMGAAWATCISYFLMAVMMFLFCRKIYPIPYEFERVGQILLLALGLWGLHYSTDALCCDTPRYALLLKITLFALFPLALYLNKFFLPAEMGELKNILSARFARKAKV